jgi:PAS domain S-box-containing protein
MAPTPFRDEIENVVAAAATTADERVQRTERRLIEAALAVNDAATLDDALGVLAETALDLVGGERVAIVVWDAQFAAGITRAEAGLGGLAGLRWTTTDAGGRLLADCEPFVVSDDLLWRHTPPAPDLSDQLAVRLCIPLRVADAGLTFHAGWAEPKPEHDLDIAITKLRLLARLTGIAFRAEQERSRVRDEARLLAVLESVPEGLVVRADNDAIVNTAARRLLATNGSPPEQINLRELDGRDVPPEATPLELAKQTRQPQQYTLRVERYDGVERIHEGTVAPVLDEYGDVFATVTVFRDVTDEHERAFVTQQFMARLFDELPLASGIADPATGEVLRVNAAMLELLGYTANEVVGAKPPYPWWSDQSEAGPELVEGEHVQRYERLFRRKDGRLVPVEMTRSLIAARDGKPAALFVLVSDLSERRAFEQQLIQSGRLASIGELAAGVAHEVNNPLFAILGLVEFLLVDATPGSKAHERLALIQETALEIKEIVRALLDFARERSDELSPISLVDVASQTVELMQRTSAAKQIEIVERYPEGPVPVFASANQLKQIFVNLISNAKQALKELGAGTITVEVDRDRDFAWAEVRDTGPGIPEDKLERIFEPFYTTRRDTGGTGLGLSVSFGIAQAHGGTLTAHSAPDGGAIFRLKLPLKEAVA